MSIGDSDDSPVYGVKSIVQHLRWLPSRLFTQGPDWSDPFSVLGEKWREVPTAGGGRTKSEALMELDDGELVRRWRSIRDDASSGSNFSVRGWYHLLYRDFMEGRRVLDIGSGLGIDGITFAEHGATVTFADLVPENLRVIERVCSELGLGDRTECRHVGSMEDLQDLPDSFDCVMAMGSLHNAPTDVMQEEYEVLADKLEAGGRWLQLAYPRSRWIRDGRPPFWKWGEMTDGAGTPWAEWYDAEKVLSQFGDATFDVVLDVVFGRGQFIWFDLVRRPTKSAS